MNTTSLSYNMPYDTRKPCIEKGCKRFASQRGRCKEHAKQYQESIQTHHKLYNTETWNRLRDWHLRRNPYCIQCGIGADLEVDHIQPHKGDPALFYNQHNLQTLCSSCHGKKTVNERN